MRPLDVARSVLWGLLWVAVYLSPWVVVAFGAAWLIKYEPTLQQIGVVALGLICAAVGAVAVGSAVQDRRRVRRYRKDRSR